VLWCSGLTSGGSQRGGGEEQSFGVLSARAVFIAGHLAYCHSPAANFVMCITGSTVAIKSSLSHIKSPLQTTTP
jgi:hypothetical protein